ncbi:413_t:CDS:1 [Acaulospora morrowiae]|uniref:413_t:CDS:1 n=1 Tax=Acaulospora morrowiae TaxID=94023 RepID=A0A9N8Z7E1_9GLOM|nr:413_t:CDS:1 [Acaulospora morrowiae]
MEHTFQLQPPSMRASKTSRSKKTSIKTTNNDFSHLLIQMPDASEVSIDEFVNRPHARIRKKSPNSFFIYRRVFVKQLLQNNYKLEMINVSKLASIYWHNEDERVRQEYKRIATMIDQKLQKIREEQPKTPMYTFVHWGEENCNPPQEFPLAAEPPAHENPIYNCESPEFDFGNFDNFEELEWYLSDFL